MPSKKIKEITPSEKQIQDCIMNYLLINGVFCWRNNTGATTYQNSQGRKRMVRYGKVGSADILGLLKDGRFLAIEVKRPKGKLTKHQEIFLDRVIESNGIAFVATSIDDVMRELNL